MLCHPTHNSLSPSTQFLFRQGFKRLLLTGLSWGNHPVTFMLLYICICIGKSLLEANSRTVVRLRRVANITEWSYQNSALQAQRKAKIHAQQSYQVQPARNLSKASIIYQTDVIYPDCNGFSTQRRLGATESLFQVRNKTTFS